MELAAWAAGRFLFFNFRLYRARSAASPVFQEITINVCPRILYTMYQDFLLFDHGSLQAHPGVCYEFRTQPLGLSVHHCNLIVVLVPLPGPLFFVGSGAV